MTFEEILDQAMAMLQRRGRVTYRTLKLQFSLDDDHLEALKDELLYAHPQVVDEDGRAWSGPEKPRQTLTQAPPSPPDQERTPLSYTPAHLTEKILDGPSRPRRRAQAGHGAVCRPQRLHGAAPRSRPRGRPAAPRPGPAPHDGRRAPLRGHGEPGPGRWHYGPLRRADRP